MTMQPLKARVKNGRLVLDEPTDLPEGEVVDLVPVVGDDLTDTDRAALHDSLEESVEQIRGCLALRWEDLAIAPAHRRRRLAGFLRVNRIADASRPRVAALTIAELAILAFKAGVPRVTPAPGLIWAGVRAAHEQEENERRPSGGASHRHRGYVNATDAASCRLIGLGARGVAARTRAPSSATHECPNPGTDRTETTTHPGGWRVGAHLSHARSFPYTGATVCDTCEPVLVPGGRFRPLAGWIRPFGARGTAGHPGRAPRRANGYDPARGSRDGDQASHRLVRSRCRRRVECLRGQ